MSHSHHNDYIDVVSAKGPASLSTKMKAIFIIMMVVGFGTFALVALFSDRPRLAWIPFLHNFYLFTGLSAAGVVIAAIIQVTRAMWGRPVKRYAEAYGAFLPYSLLFLAILYFGAGNLYEWTVEGLPEPQVYANKAFWLQQNFVFGRVLLYLVILILLSRAFMKHSLRPDLGLAHEKNPDLWNQPANWRGLEEEVAESQRKQSKIGVFYCFAFAYCISMIAYDLIMSLDYRWVSTMFGGWNFATFMLAGWGSMVLVTALMSKRHGVDGYIHKLCYHDLGKLTFGFTIVWGYLFFAQLMVIWYGNLGHEAGYLLTRIRGLPWRPFTWIAGSMVFLLPFFLGLGKQRKMSPATFGPVVFISLIGIWLERWVLIAPAAWYFDRHKMVFQPGHGLLLFLDGVVFLGFLGLFCLTYTKHLYAKPVMVISDPRLDAGINRH